jgi:hypothetical protein
MESTGAAGIGVMVGVGLGVGVDVAVGSADGLIVAGTTVDSTVFSNVLEAMMGAVDAIVGVNFLVAMTAVSDELPSWHATSPQIKISSKGAKIFRI